MTSVVVGAEGTLGQVLVSKLGVRGIDFRCNGVGPEEKLAELEGADVVINAGGPRVRPGLSARDYFREHVGVVRRVVRSMRRGAHLVHLSSTAVYGARRAFLAANAPEAPELFPNPAYACAKFAAELCARSLCGELGMRLTVLRPSMVYGPSIDSALETLRTSKKARSLRLSPAHLRQHLLFVDLLVCVVKNASKRTSEGTLVLPVADPFVLTNADLVPPGQKGALVKFDVPLSGVRAMHDQCFTWLGERTPLALEAFAVLALDNEFDALPTLSALSIDASEFCRARTFDRYWNGDA